MWQLLWRKIYIFSTWYIKKHTVLSLNIQRCPRSTVYYGNYTRIIQIVPALSGTGLLTRLSIWRQIWSHPSTFIHCWQWCRLLGRSEAHSSGCMFVHRAAILVSVSEPRCLFKSWFENQISWAQLPVSQHAATDRRPHWQEPTPKTAGARYCSSPGRSLRCPGTSARIYVHTYSTHRWKVARKRLCGG